MQTTTRSAIATVGLVVAIFGGHKIIQGKATDDVIGTVVKSAIVASADGDGRGTCESLTPHGMQVLWDASSEAACEANVRDQAAQAPIALRESVRGVQVIKVDRHGDAARVTIRTPPSAPRQSSSVLTVRKVGGVWKIDS